MDYLGLLIPRREFKVPIVGRRLQLIKKQEFIQGNHLLVMNYEPYGHATNDQLLGIRNKLPWSDIKIG